MPTVLALDVSLSMSRQVFQPDRAEDPPTVRQLAIKGIHALLNHIHHNCKLEFAALVRGRSAGGGDWAVGCKWFDVCFQ